MAKRIIEKAELSSHISPKNDRNLPVHNWYSFKHGFSRDLVLDIINNFNLYPGSWVLDPFCGSGTTLLACKESGIHSQGFDILPFSVFLSNVKTVDYDEEELRDELKLLRRNFYINYSHISLPEIPIVNKAFSTDVRNELLKLKQRIDKVRHPKNRSLLNLAFLSILESVSNTSKAGGFLRIVDRKVSIGNIHKLFLDRANGMLKDIEEFNKSKKPERVYSKAEIGDARQLKTSREYDAIITSPPYPNRHDYTRIYALEMLFDFVSSNDELKKIRYDTIRSHVEAKKKYEPVDYGKPKLLDALIGEVKRNGTNNPRVIDMLEGYFEDMYLSLSEIYRCLKNNGQAAMVISNVRYAGVNILVDEILYEIGSQVGLNPREIWVVRYRGNSSQQMRDYKRAPSRESVVIWGKDA